MHHVATKYNPIMTVEDQTMLKAQRAEKLRKLEEAKELDLKKTEKKYMESMDWYEKYEPLG